MLDDDTQWTRWINCILVAFVVTVAFLLLCTSTFCRWISGQIPQQGYRVASVACIIFAVTFVAVAAVFYRGED
jgi:uncharacterized membrane protein